MTHASLLNLPFEAETPRLYLRPPQTGDGPMLQEAAVESLDELRRFPGAAPWAMVDMTDDYSELYCRLISAEFVTRTQLTFLLMDKATGELVGSAGFYRPDWTVPSMEIGYWIRTSRTGEGLASEAVVTLVAYAFKFMHAARLELTIDEQNIASRRVAERCGFVLEGVHRHNRRTPSGALNNTCVYALCRDQRRAEITARAQAAANRPAHAPA